MTSELDFIAALDAEPGNHWLRQVYADFLEDLGDERAAGMRMLAVLGRVPWYWDGSMVWGYFGVRYFGKKYLSEESNSVLSMGLLPVAWLKGLRSFPKYSTERKGGRYFPSRAAAENAAALAWLRLTDAERAKIMAETLTGGRHGTTA